MSSVSKDLEAPKQEKMTYVKHYIGMVLIGIINNLPYWCGITSAQAICTHFKKEGYIGAITAGCVLFGVFATATNTFLSSRNVSYITRVIANGIFMITGLIGTAFAPNIYVAIVTIAVVGLSSDFGEGAMLGYFAYINDNSLLRAWGVGTGISGMIGAIYAFLCQYYKISYFWTFIYLSPCGVIYPILFITMLDSKKEQDLAKTESMPSLLSYESLDPEVPFCSVRLWKGAAYFVTNNFFMFVFQYTMIEGLCDCSMTKAERLEQPYIFSLLQIFYQLGQLISKLPLPFFNISKIYIITILNGINFGVLLSHVALRFLNVYWIIGLMLLNGFLGGLSYMNIFKEIMKLKDFYMKEKEIITNYTSMFISGSIEFSSWFIVFLQNIVFPQQCKGI